MKLKLIILSLITTFFFSSCEEKLSKIESDNYTGFIQGDPTIKLEVPFRMGEFGKGFISNAPSKTYSLTKSEDFNKRKSLIKKLGLRFNSFDEESYTSSNYSQNTIVYQGYTPFSKDRVVELIGFGEMPLDKTGKQSVDFYYMLVLSNSQGEILDKDTLAIFSNYDDQNIIYREGVILSEDQYMTIDYEYKKANNIPTEIVLHRKMFSIEDDKFTLQKNLSDFIFPCDENALDFVGQFKNENKVKTYWSASSAQNKSSFKPLDNNSFQVSLIKKDNKILGQYCYTSQGRIDCFFGDDYSFEFNNQELLKNKEVTFKFRSGYSNTWGEAKIIKVSEDKIHWKVTKAPKGECYAYDDVEMLRI
ncbi:hypothetical protein KMW28_22870 [Flammeovirga yaeyamensis]|uniref:Lipoprotein n=1 Tax=Flammeovirga yaeyamensis TaxID=367791 RepID=A0AAX1NCL4_9BACT|nr:hypothetical protein [Flammeovirga yaeyamensis]MBB3696793.1 hypothetical protein [Flammeovirga yaeyamensis]NMF33459.1 hypothetical protein [Flammeovirga yaeyamensis]QWG05266.1 hypothetical protein KMW28_22870 [Flammeovirga yaeyamensis]